MSWEHAQRVRRAMDKKEHPEKYCPDKKCLRLRGVCRKHPGGRDLQGKTADLMVVDDLTEPSGPEQQRTVERFLELADKLRVK